MRIPKETIEAVRERTDIIEVISRDVTLKRRGRNFLGLCPFHQEKTPSFNVLPDRQIYHCFGCGEGGDVFKFLMKTQGLSFVEAVKELAAPAGVTIEERALTREDRLKLRRRASLHEACAAACDWFQANLLTRPEGAAARAYLERRGMSGELIERARLGFAPAGWSALLDHLHKLGIDGEVAERAGLARRSERGRGRYDVFRDRVIFPILDSRDRPIAFGGRLLEGEGPKYLNSPESDIYDKSATLYGLSWARPFIQRRDRVLVVEGYFDVLSLYQAGFGEAVATCGTSLTEAHARQIRRLTGTVIALFDSDEAGLRAADRSLPIFLAAGLEARHLELEGAKDPDEFVQQYGAEALEARMDASVPLIERAIRRAAARHGGSPGGRQRAAQELAPLLRQLQGTLRSHMLMRTADLLQIRDDSLKELLGREAGARRLRAQPAAAVRWTPPTDLRELLRLLLHFPEQVAEPLSRADPDQVTPREDVKWAIAQLLTGSSLAAVLHELGDGDLSWWLQSLAAERGPDTAETAGGTAARLLRRLELRHLELRIREMSLEIQDIQKRLPALKHQLSEEAYAAEQEAWRGLIQERAVLQRRSYALRSGRPQRR